MTQPPKQVPGAFRPRYGSGGSTPPLRGKRRHIVNDGDGLLVIAGVYGHATPQGAQELYRLNAATIENAAEVAGYGNSHSGQILIVGTVLDIPGTW